MGSYDYRKTQPARSRHVADGDLKAIAREEKVEAGRPTLTLTVAIE